jgi:DNA-binding NarL/FixJ family response regulator
MKFLREIETRGQAGIVAEMASRRLSSRPEPARGTGGEMTTSTASIRVMTVDDHPLLLEGLGMVIRTQPDMCLAGQASNCCEAIQQFSKLRPDVTLMDLMLPDMSGIDGMIAIQTQFPQARIIIMTTFEGDAPVGRALRAGAHSYILKSMPPAGIIDAIRQVHAGKKSVPEEIAAKVVAHLGDEKLTDREAAVLRHAALGHRNRDIGGQLFISEATVKVHMKRIMEKLGARDRTEAVTIAARRGFIQL